MANEVTAVTVYEVDDQGDPAPATRAEFLKVTTPSGMYFEPQTGDFIIPALGFGLYVVQGFHTPPPPR